MVQARVMTRGAYSDVVSRGLSWIRQPDQESGADADQSLDHEQLGIAFLNHRAELLGFAARSLGGQSLAEEAVQETFVRALASHPGFDSTRGAIRSWLFAIERHVLIDLARARLAHPEGEIDPNSPSAEDQIETAMRAWQVEAALSKLGADHRQVVLEIYYRGRPSRELALELGIPEGTVRSRLYYALQALRVSLHDMDLSP
jgi:RNA polymerase sigma-70 factor (ECF subfamily)